MHQHLNFNFAAIAQWLLRQCIAQQHSGVLRSNPGSWAFPDPVPLSLSLSSQITCILKCGMWSMYEVLFQNSNSKFHLPMRVNVLHTLLLKSNGICWADRFNFKLCFNILFACVVIRCDLDFSSTKNSKDY